MIIFVAFFIHFVIHFASILHTLLCLKLAPHTTVCHKVGAGDDPPQAPSICKSAAPCLQGSMACRIIFQVPIRTEGSLAPHTPRRHPTVLRGQNRYFHFGVILASKTHSRGTIFLTPSWYPLVFGFGAILVPTCLREWSQNPPKIDPRAVQYPSQHPSYYRSLFLLIFDGFSIDFRPRNQ